MAAFLRRTVFSRPPEPTVLQVMLGTVTNVNEHWWKLPERAVVPETVLERIDANGKAMNTNPFLLSGKMTGKRLRRAKTQCFSR